MGDVKLAAVMGLFLGRAVGPAMFVALDRRHARRRLIMARKGVAEGPQDRDPVRPVPRPRRRRRPVRGRRDRRLVPRHLQPRRSLGRTPPDRLKARRMGADKPSEMRAVNLLPPDLAQRRPRLRRDQGRRPRLRSPWRRRLRRARRARRSACVALAAYVLTTNTVKDRQAELDAVTAQAAAVQPSAPLS